MPGFSDYLAEGALNFATGQQGLPTAASGNTLGNRFLALFTAAPTSDAGTGGTEVSGGSYARVQVAGALAVSGSSGAPSTASATITLAATAPAWLTALGTNGSGVNVFDLTNGKQIGTVSSISGTTVTLTGNAANNGSLGDSLQFSAFPAASASSGTEPSVTPSNVTNGASITFPQATATWGTVVFFGIYDAVTSGNFLGGDYIGNNKWVPFTCTSASPGVLTVDSAADVPANATSCVVTSKFGGTLPTTAGSWAGVLTSAGASANTFNLGVNTTSTGSGQFRQITQQSIPANVTASFATSTLTLSVA